jgi:hypothetical protein
MGGTAILTRYARDLLDAESFRLVRGGQLIVVIYLMYQVFAGNRFCMRIAIAIIIGNVLSNVVIHLLLAGAFRYPAVSAPVMLAMVILIVYTVKEKALHQCDDWRDAREVARRKRDFYNT